MRWLPFLLVILSGLFPIENLADTIEGELMVRSTWSILLILACHFLIKSNYWLIVLICESLSIAYNFTIAAGYYFTDKDLGAGYAGLMIILFCVELWATFPEVRRERRNSGERSNRYRRRSYGNYDLAAASKMQVDTCKA